MKYEVTKLPKSQVEILVVLPAPDFESYVKRAAVLISEKTDIEGFRRGKAPYDVVKKRVGESAIYEEAANLAIRKTYPEVLEKIFAEKKNQGENFTPIGRPEVTVTKLAPGNELEYKIKIALLPEIALPDYRSIAARVRQKKQEVKVEEKEVESALNWVRESRAQYVTVDRAGELGDAVEVDFEVRSGGIRVDQGDSKTPPFILGKSKFMPGFEENIVGMRSGDEKTFSLTTPDSWHDKSLSGKTLDFTVRLKLVQERSMPELTDNFVKGLGNFGSLEEFKASVRDGILEEKKGKELQRIRSLTIEEVAAGAVVDIPDVLIAAELEKMLHELRMGIEGMGMKWEDYLLHIKKDVEGLKKDWVSDAEKRVNQALALREIARREQVEVLEEEVETRARDTLQKFGSPEDAKKDIDPEELKEYTRGVLRNEKVFELLENSG